ncbi:MAG: hypothetical protein A2428_17170 [Bdellovibrionales bacterium RIFOXYC1_FULL_54_43]|nr:MAG: hypothetical protein A2428_17170 [Bdellovibrionales bacterium RIFOXYC1_FULL_54_43]OFZ82061.1 MAG: hypothetical protein A2603_01545 [Bdellovibrionales bacterium RIFOXYD1_FULL_55_31]
MNLIILSDLHLLGPEDPFYPAVLTLIREANRGDRLVFAGDVFELFVGAKKLFLERHAEFLSASRDAAARGVSIDYIEGNHDFLLEKVFGEISGFRVHDGGLEFEIDGKCFYVAHGDQVDRSDFRYLVLRRFFRSVIMRAFVRLAPDALIDWLGTRMSKKSRKNGAASRDRQTRRADRLRPIFREFATRQVARGADFVVLGHSHDADELAITAGDRHGFYMNTGDPRSNGSYVSWMTGSGELIRMKLISPSSPARG